jgi:hypothetical protein
LLGVRTLNQGFAVSGDTACPAPETYLFFSLSFTCHEVNVDITNQRICVSVITE